MKRIILVVVGILFISASVSGFFVFKSKLSKDNKKTDRIEVVRRGAFVVRLSERGSLDSLVKVEVRSNVEGEIEKLYVDEGYDVVKGQELLKIDEKQIREEYNQAEANYNAAVAELDRAKENALLNMSKLESDIQLAENDLESAKANLAVIKARNQQQLSQARISISNLENLLAQDKINLTKAELALKQAKNNEATARVRFENAKAELERKQGLYEKKFISRHELETAQLEYASAKSDYESALNNIQSQTSNIEAQKKIIENREISLKAEMDDLETLKNSIAEEERQAQLRVEQAQERLNILKKNKERELQIISLAQKTAEANKIRAQSALNTARQRLGWTTVTAPISGRIIQCKVEEGEIITSGRTAWSQGPPLMTIADLSQMIVKVYMHEIDISKLRVGQKAEIRVDSYPNEVFEGEVKEISPSAQLMDNVIKFEVIVKVTKAPKPLLPGMSADVDIIVSERDNVLQLPLEAVITKETLKVKTDLRREQAEKLRNKKVEIVMKSYPDRKFPGRVFEVSASRAGMISSTVTIIMDGTPKELEPGKATTADIIISETGETIPNIEARIERERRDYAQLVKDMKQEGKSTVIETEERMIRTGERNQSSVEIIDGLREGDRVRVVPIGEEEKKK